jgi:diguanylate cyclase (GGDEF)-like protein
VRFWLRQEWDGLCARLAARVRGLCLAVQAWVRPSRRRSPSLVNRILSLQLTITAAIGGFALAGLAWTSHAITDENLARWAARWSTQLNELGAPLYVDDDVSAMLDIESFVATYPEVARVDWFAADGRHLFSVPQQAASSKGALDGDLLDALRAGVGTDTPQLLERDDSTTGRYQLLGPIWSEAFAGDGLINLGSNESPATTREVLGFVAVELDYSWHERELSERLLFGGGFLLLLLGLSWAVGRAVLKQALLPLSGLQQPLSQLASGNMQVEFEPARHEEIQNIIHTLETTTAALAQRDRRLLHLATHDSLTGLHNRHAFVQALNEEIERLPDPGSRSAVLFIDLDQFKYVNDTCGHPAGDELLRMAARSIEATTRGSDFVARFGGDEFAVLARGVSRKQAHAIGENILRHMSMLTHVHENKVFHLQCSIGIAMVRRAGIDPHEYLSRADIACHAAKENGRNRLEIYRVSRREDRQMANEVGWVQRVRRALEQDAFVLVYQPMVKISTGSTDHYEVLLRLETDDGSLISPDVFLPAADRFGLMVDIDHWVLENVIKALAEQRMRRSGLCFSMNLSASAFENRRLGKDVESLLAGYDVPPDAVILEITEQTAVRFAMGSDKQISMIRDLGCRFAIDDFGKGYSSFSYLRELPVDFLKIDGSFVENLEKDRMNQTLVRVIGEVARVAGMETVAESVQSAKTLELLTRLGIDYAQGFFLGRPSREPADAEASGWWRAKGRKAARRA